MANGACYVSNYIIAFTIFQDYIGIYPIFVYDENINFEIIRILVI